MKRGEFSASGDDVVLDMWVASFFEVKGRERVGQYGSDGDGESLNFLTPPSDLILYPYAKGGGLDVHDSMNTSCNTEDLTDTNSINEE